MPDYKICCKASGPSPARIAIVGEAPGKDEELLGLPFIGASGQELTRILRDAGIDREECFITNAFQIRPPNNKIEALCGNKAEVGGKLYNLPPLRTGKYIKPEFFPELLRLKEELLQCKPNIVLALGATASWALLANPKITSLRGTCAESTLVPGLKVLPTYHPAAILRQWELRAITVADCMKAARESTFPEIVRPRRELWIEPTLSDIAEFYRKYLAQAEKIDFDIETERGQITCISFAPSPDIAICIPFWDKRKNGYSYWSEEEELKALWWVRFILNLPCAKEGQNGLYDIQYLWRFYGIPVRNYLHDTMLLHHAIQPELPKGLGFLGSVYTNEGSWKELRTLSDKDITKRDE